MIEVVRYDELCLTSVSYTHLDVYKRQGGVWADRYSRKKLIICADASIAAVTFVMILLMPYISTEPLLLGALLLMSIIRSIGAGIQSPAVNAVIPQLVPQEDLMRYNGINSTMQSIVPVSYTHLHG